MDGMDCWRIFAILFVIAVVIWLFVGFLALLKALARLAVAPVTPIKSMGRYNLALIVAVIVGFAIGGSAGLWAGIAVFLIGMAVVALTYRYFRV